MPSWNNYAYQYYISPIDSIDGLLFVDQDFHSYLKKNYTHCMWLSFVCGDLYLFFSSKDFGLYISCDYDELLDPVKSSELISASRYKKISMKKLDYLFIQAGVDCSLDNMDVNTFQRALKARSESESIERVRVLSGHLKGNPFQEILDMYFDMNIDLPNVLFDIPI
jgi:hypothetical protein